MATQLSGSRKAQPTEIYCLLTVSISVFICKVLSIALTQHIAVTHVNVQLIQYIALKSYATNICVCVRSLKIFDMKLNLTKDC